jgi:hypothetical protein
MAAEASKASPSWSQSFEPLSLLSAPTQAQICSAPNQCLSSLPYMTPLRDMLAEMTTIRREHVAFEFSVVRDNRGFMQKITATPVAPTQH